MKFSIPKISIKSKTGKKNKIALAVLIPLIIVGIVVVFGVITASLGLTAYKAIADAGNQAQQIPVALAAQDFDRTRRETQTTLDKLKLADSLVGKLAYLQSLPVAKDYYHDIKSMTEAGVLAVESAITMEDSLAPHVALLGFQGEGTYTGGSVENRIRDITRTLKEIAPHLDEASRKLAEANQKVSTIDPYKYPVEYQGKSIRAQIVMVQQAVGEAYQASQSLRPIFEILPQVLGYPDEQRYLVLFQNDAELRPTGGFLTAYAILSAKEGVIQSERSNDIYELDARFKKHLKAPEPILKYLDNVPYWYLRDMNLSPDFKTSMDTFYKYYREVPGEGDVNGIIAVDTQVLEQLVNILGPVTVPGYGTFTSEVDPACDCPQVIYQLELIADKPGSFIKDSRKAVLGPLMKQIMAKALRAKKDQWPDLFSTLFKMIGQKHILFYFPDEKLQNAVEGVNAAGRVAKYDADYFYLNDANFGGAKSNLYITQQVTQDIQVASDGTITKNVRIKYTNPKEWSDCNLESGALCLNGEYRDYVRLLVPSGSQLISTENLMVEPEVSNDLGKTVFAGFFRLRPQNSATISFKYQLPFKMNGPYKMFLQKQPGTDSPQYQINIGGATESFELTSDKELVINPN